jgi:hypothetical protein
MNRLLYRLFRCIYSVRRWFVRQFTASGLMVLLCLMISAVVGMDTNQSLAYQIFTFLCALVGVAIAASQFFRFRFSAERILPRFGTVGVALKYGVVIQNQTRKRQTGLILSELLAESYPSFREFMTSSATKKSTRGKPAARYPGILLHPQPATVKDIHLPILQPGQQTKITVEVQPLQRGMLRLKGLTIACPDPLGLFKGCVTRSLPQSILILPKRYQLPPITLPGSRRHQSGQVALASSVGDSEEFRALRDYRPGDSPREIHPVKFTERAGPRSVGQLSKRSRKNTLCVMH